MYGRTDDPIADFDRRDRDLSLRLKRLPVCCECGEYIQEMYAYRKDGLWTCQRCMNEYLEEVEEA